MEKACNKGKSIEQVDDEAIVLDSQGPFPRKVIILDKGNRSTEYRLIKTKAGGYILNK